MTTTCHSELPPLPALKGLGKLAEMRPTVVIDSREQDPLPISRLESVRCGLLSGDYSFAGGEHIFSIERKSVSDLVGCCTNSNRERFERELVRLRGYHFKRLLIVGTREEIQSGAYRSTLSPKVVFSTLCAFEVRYDIPVVFEADPVSAARHVESWVWWYAREVTCTANDLARNRPKSAATATD